MVSGQELASYPERLNLILEFANRITSNVDIHEVLRATASSIQQLMNCDFVHVGTPAAESDRHEILHYSIDGSPQQKVAVSPSGAILKAFAQSAPILLREMKPENHAPEMYQFIIREGIKSVWLIPLVSRGRLLGVLGLSSRREDAFRQQDATFLMQVGSQIAIAIENAAIFRELSELKERFAQEKLYLEAEIRGDMEFEGIVGQSAALHHLLQLVETVGQTDSTVLLIGETGTGKELIARAVHEHSRRQGRTFVKLNCAAIPTGLLESELFGHEKGAFTGAIAQKVGRMELADQGTLFLDEVGDIPIEIQPKLLRALQEREFERLGSTHTRKVNVRLVAATNRDLEQMISNREFRADLYYRLNVFPIRIPPLRERREDIPLLVSYFVQKYSRQMGKEIDSVPASASKLMSNWNWPGNVRELENFIERSVILTRGKSLEAPLGELRKVNAEEPENARTRQDENNIAQIVKKTVSAINSNKRIAINGNAQQREEISRVLTETKGRVGGADGAAIRMGINRTTLLSRMKKLGLTSQQFVE